MYAEIYFYLYKDFKDYLIFKINEAKLKHWLFISIGKSIYFLSQINCAYIEDSEKLLDLVGVRRFQEVSGGSGSAPMGPQVLNFLGNIFISEQYEALIMV